MLMYHGSYIEIETPEVKYSRDNLDFGKGFYLARDYKQAEKWAMRFARKNFVGVVNIYEIDVAEIEKKYQVRYFDHYDEEWLQFVVEHRKGKGNKDYDVVSGGIANDRVFNTIELYLDGLIGENEALGRLRYEAPNWQMCIRKQDILNDYVRFQGSVEVKV